MVDGQKREQRMVRLPPDLHDKLKARAIAQDLTTAQALRRAVRAYLSAPLPEDTSENA